MKRVIDFAGELVFFKSAWDANLSFIKNGELPKKKHIKQKKAIEWFSSWSAQCAITWNTRGEKKTGFLFPLKQSLSFVFIFLSLKSKSTLFFFKWWASLFFLSKIDNFVVPLFFLYPLLFLPPSVFIPFCFYPLLFLSPSIFTPFFEIFLLSTASFCLNSVF